MRILLLVFLFSPLSAFADEREECQIALVEDIGGTVDLISPAGDKTSVAQGQPVQPGDLVRTAPDSFADLRLCDGTGLRVGESSRFYYNQADNAREHFAAWAFELVKGTLRAAVVGDGKSEQVKVRVRTPSASLGVRGTELVIDTDDAGSAPTELHTIEGEVLMGPRDDFEKMGTLRGSELTARFEPVGAEKMSVIHAGEAHPLKAAAFQLWEFKAARKRTFSRPLEKRGAGEVRARFREAHEHLKARRAERGLFERQRETIEKRMEPAAPARAQAERAEKVRERIQERARAREEAHERRAERLEEKLRSNAEKTENRRQRRGWEKRRNVQPGSPRFNGQ